MTDQAIDYGTIIDDMAGDGGQRTRASFSVAVGTDPDAEARTRSIARQTGLPAITVQNMPDEARQKARIGTIDFATLEKTTPSLAALLADVEKAKIAHDDVEQLGLIERTTRQFFGSGGETVGRSVHGFGVLADVAQRRALSGFANLFLPAPRGGGAATDESLAGPLIGEDLTEIGKNTLAYYRKNVMLPPEQQTFGDKVVGGLGQVVTQIAMLPIDRGASLYAQGASIMSERVEGDDAPQLNKDLAIAGGAAVTGVTERLAIDKLIGPAAPQIKNQLAAALARIGGAAAAEGGQEAAEGIAHDLLQRVLTNPDQKIDFGQAAEEAGVAGTVGAIVRSVVEAGLHIRSRGQRGAQAAQQAEADAQAVGQLGAMAQASRLRERDPAAFAALLEDVTDGGRISELYISAQALAQSGKAEQIAAASPTVAEQLPTAYQNGGDVRIPVPQFFAELGGYAQDLADHVRTSPDAMTRAEARQFASQQAEGIDQDELNRLAIEQHTDLTRTEQVREIEADITQQLNTAGRFSPAVNRAYAALPSAFFDTISQRLGVSPAELYAQHAPRFVAQPVAGSTLMTGALEQPQRGAYVPDTNTIALLKDADLSTALHELGHYFLESYGRMATGAPALQGDMQTVLDWFGVKDLATWQGMSLEQRREHHERFARGFETWLHEGTAPSLKLQDLFARFRAWLARVYRDIKGLDVELSDEVRAVFSRMLATQEHIDEAARSRAMSPLFDEAQATAAGIDWQQYRALGQEATDTALAALDARSLRDMTWTAKLREETIRRLNRDAADARKALRREVEAEVQREPVYAALRWFKRGEMTTPDGEQIKATAGHRLSIPALKEMYGTEQTDRPAFEKLGYGKFGALAEEGLHPDLAAEMFGFRSGDAMVRELLAAPPMREAVEALTDLRMLERYGELATPDAIARSADQAVHNDVRTRFLATELAGLQKATGGAQALTKMAKDYAARLVNNTKAGAIRPNQHAAAAVRAGKAAEAALRRGDTRDAIKQKRYQLVQHAATRAAYEAQAEVEKTVAAFRGIADAKTEAVAKTRNMDIVNAARAILAEHGVGMRGKSPRAYMEAVKAYDPELYATLEPELLDAEANAQPIKEMTVTELRALRDTIESLWYLARRQRQVEIDGKLVDREQVTNDLAGRLDELGVPETAPGEGHAVTEGEKSVRYLMGARAALRRVEHWVDRMDGGDIRGAFRRYIWQPISEAADAYRTDSGKYLARYRNLLKAIEPTLRAGKIEAAELGYTFGYSKGGAGKAEVLHALLHTGNESNKRKLLLGRGWAKEQADGSLDTSQWDAFIARMIREGRITKADYNFAQGVWDLLEETKPMAQRTHREVFGRYFDEITADEFTTPFGTYRGGYVPAVYDSFEVQDATINNELDAINQGNSFMFPSTNRGFTKGRVEYNRPLALDLRLLPQHIDKVMLFAHLEPKVRDVMRTLRAKGFTGTLNRYDPTAYTDLLLPWLNRAAKQTVETPATGWGGKLADRFFRTMRSRSGMAAMFANLTNAMQQITGLSITALKVKPAYLKAAAWRYLRAPSEVAEQVAARSPFMASRMDNQIHDMRQQIDALLLNPNSYEKAQAWTARHAYFLQSAFQNVVDNITWMGAYDQAVAGGLTEAEAIRSANAAVRETQGSLSPEDISRFESGTAFTRVFTQFTSYFNMQANILGTEFATVAQDMGLRKGAGRMFYILLLGLLVPAWMSEAIVQGMRGGVDDEDGDGYLDEFLAFFFGAPVRNAAAMVPIAGQSAMLIANSFNRKPYDDRMSTAPAVSMIESAASAPHSIYKAIADEGSAKRAIRDTLTLVTITTGLPVAALGKPLGYAAEVSQDRVRPTGPLDAARGALSGVASAESKQ